jgi:hypothetical protein
MFTILALGFCANMISHMGNDLVSLGQIIADECDPFALMGESYGQTARIKGHDFGAHFFEDGVEVWLDGVRYIVPRTIGA